MPYQPPPLALETTHNTVIAQSAQNTLAAPFGSLRHDLHLDTVQTTPLPPLQPLPSTYSYPNYTRDDHFTSSFLEPEVKVHCDVDVEDCLKSTEQKDGALPTHNLEPSSFMKECIEGVCENATEESEAALLEPMEQFHLEVVSKEAIEVEDVQCTQLKVDSDTNTLIDKDVQMFSCSYPNFETPDSGPLGQLSCNVSENGESMLAIGKVIPQYPDSSPSAFKLKSGGYKHKLPYFLIKNKKFCLGKHHSKVRGCYMVKGQLSKASLSLPQVHKLPRYSHRKYGFDQILMRVSRENKYGYAATLLNDHFGRLNLTQTLLCGAFNIGSEHTAINRAFLDNHIGQVELFTGNTLEKFKLNSIMILYKTWERWSFVIPIAAKLVCDKELELFPRTINLLDDMNVSLVDFSLHAYDVIDVLQISEGDWKVYPQYKFTRLMMNKYMESVRFSKSDELRFAELDEEEFVNGFWNFLMPKFISPTDAMISVASNLWRKSVVSLKLSSKFMGADGKFLTLAMPQMKILNSSTMQWEEDNIKYSGEILKTDGHFGVVVAVPLDRSTHGENNQTSFDHIAIGIIPLCDCLHSTMALVHFWFAKNYFVPYNHMLEFLLHYLSPYELTKFWIWNNKALSISNEDIICTFSDSNEELTDIMLHSVVVTQFVLVELETCIGMRVRAYMFADDWKSNIDIEVQLPKLPPTKSPCLLDEEWIRRWLLNSNTTALLLLNALLIVKIIGARNIGLELYTAGCIVYNFMKRMSINFGELSLYTSGTLIFEKCLTTSSIPHGEAMVSELSTVQIELCNTRRGSHLMWRKLNMDGFVAEFDQWHSSLAFSTVHILHIRALLLHGFIKTKILHLKNIMDFLKDCSPPDKTKLFFLCIEAFLTCKDGQILQYCALNILLGEFGTLSVEKELALHIFYIKMSICLQTSFSFQEVSTLFNICFSVTQLLYVLWLNSVLANTYFLDETQKSEPRHFSIWDLHLFAKMSTSHLSYWLSRKMVFTPTGVLEWVLTVYTIQLRLVDQDIFYPMCGNGADGTCFLVAKSIKHFGIIKRCQALSSLNWFNYKLGVQVTLASLQDFVTFYVSSCFFIEYGIHLSYTALMLHIASFSNIIQQILTPAITTRPSLTLFSAQA